MTSKVLAKASLRSRRFSLKGEGGMKCRRGSPEGDPGHRDHGCPCSHPRSAGLDIVCKAAFTDFHDNTGVLGEEVSRPGKFPLGVEENATGLS